MRNHRPISTFPPARAHQSGSRMGWWLCLGALIAAPGCTLHNDSDLAPVDETVPETHEQPLFQEGNTWPNGVVPVCYHTTFPEQTRLAQKARRILQDSWSKAANVNFVGWDACDKVRAAWGPSVVFLAFWPEDGGNTSSQGPVGDYTTAYVTQNDSLGNEPWFTRVVNHEFGHVLGFGHEQERPDNFNPNPVYCPVFQPGREHPYLGVWLTPEFDRDSIMSYCNANSHLSTGDIYGARAAYGRNNWAHGFMIELDKDRRLALNAWGGAAEGTLVRLSQDCTPANPDCTWSFRDGMIVSDRNPRLALNAWGGAVWGQTLLLTSWCTPDNPDCTWTYYRGQFRSDRNLSLTIKAWNNAQHGDPISLANACLDSDLSCSWTLPWVILRADSVHPLAVSPVGGASFGAALALTDLCQPWDPNCIWMFQKGMITSFSNGMAMNAFGGAQDTTVVRLHSGCTKANPDCTWQWSKRGIRSDRNPSLYINPVAFTTAGSNLYLRSNLEFPIVGDGS
jgi:hypothetical protein